ncbi:MAG TPA: heparinase II/III family protein [Opitutales bacterium]|jgi:hypothetical protein|nr:heparinase II/III family protein [Opitutales bacterium]
MNFLRKSALVWKFLGPRWVAFRLRYAAEMRLGLLARRSPCQKWSDIETAVYLPDWLSPTAFPESGKGWGNRCVSEADGLALGEFILFSHHQTFPGCPPDWHKNPLTGQSAPRGRHWSKLGDFDFGDIKAIWELSRFGWAFALARAYARTHEERFAELFWKLFEDWCAQNTPNEGVNWKCGQESTFRLFAATFAICEFRHSPNTTRERWLLWARFVKATGQRIVANLDYALSQSNNHGVSECVGLITASLLSGDTKLTRSWRDLAYTKLHEQLDTLIYPDGGFSQHALIYHRVLLHDLLWLISFSRKAGQSMPDWVVAKTRSALNFLFPLVDVNTGGVPLYGTNDGANILPLDECAFDDLRGIIQAGFALLDGVCVYPPGPWDEAAYWIAAKDPSTLPIHPPSNSARWHAPDAGCFQWSSSDARLFLRCPTHFRHRPSQADMLHADIWWRGRAIAHDAGTYSNNMPAPLGGVFGNAVVHNVPMLADREPLEKAGRFLYLPWPTGTAQWDESAQCFRATHAGYGPDAELERSISSPQLGVFVVRDQITLRTPTRIRLHWLLTDADWTLDSAARTVTAQFNDENYVISWESNLPAVSANLVRADPACARGWWSRHYLAVEPAVSFELLFDVADKLEVSTTFTPLRV